VQTSVRSVHESAQPQSHIYQLRMVLLGINPLI
jgi:hypothetical protein